MTWTQLCTKDDLVDGAGVAALYKGEQVALFYQTQPTETVFAISNWDPISKANVLSRGLIGDANGELYVASPLLKERYALKTGECLDDASLKVTSWPVKITDDLVYITDAV